MSEYNQYHGQTSFDHSAPQRIGVLLVNLGTPEAPTKKALYPYLKDFLADPRVIEVSPLVWKVILNLFILPFRPKRSAELYKNVWTEHGSPLLLYTESQAKLLQQELQRRLGDGVVCHFAMRIGSPSIEHGLLELERQGVTRLLVVPMFPQYSGTTTGSVFDGVTQELQRWRWIPEFRMMTHYHDDPGYIRALANSVREVWKRDGEAEKLLISFHGIPKRYFLSGDPYFCECQKTARLLTEELGLGKERFIVSFQSLFGKEEWLRPYTEETVIALAKSGVKSLDVICPGFSVDCLETIDEINREIRHVYEEHGGGNFRYIPCLNDRADFIESLAGVCERQLQGWLPASSELDQRREADERVQRVQALR